MKAKINLLPFFLVAGAYAFWGWSGFGYACVFIVIIGMLDEVW